MALLQIWFSLLVVALLLLGIRRGCLQRGLPPPPLRLPLLAALVWALVASVPLGGLPASSRLWLLLSDDLMVALAAIRLLIWLAVELPAGLGWWRKPPQLLVQLLTLGSSALAVVVILRQGAQLDLLSLVTTSAVLTAVVGLASQESLKDLISGLELQLSNDFRVGDWIELPGGQKGTVTSMSWRDCSLRNIDDCLLVVPNRKITAEVLNNRSHFGYCAQRFEVGLDYSFPPAHAQQLLGEVVGRHPDVLQDPAPQVRLANFADSAITYEIQVWSRTPGGRAELDLRSALLSQIWYALRREGQSIPFPVRQVEPRRQPPASRLDTPVSLQSGILGTGVFADLTDGQRRALLESSQTLSYGPGEVIVMEGAEGDSLYVVLSGEVVVLKRVEDRQRVLRQLGPKEVFGEMTLLLDAPRSATVRAVKECRLLQVGRPAVRALLDQDPALLERFAQLMAARQAELDNLSTEEEREHSNGLLSAMKRLFSALAGS